MINCIKLVFKIFVISAVMASCSETRPKQIPLFISMPAAHTGINFNNTVSYTDSFNVFKYRNFFNGGGVAIGDVNNDGLPDIFFTANQQSNKLYINQGNFKFLDATRKAGLQGIHKWHTGVTMVDINADGWLDIYVCNSGDLNGDDRANELYINQKNGTFKEDAKLYGLDDKGLSTHAAFFDYDHDGDLDCYVLNNSFRPIESFGFDVNQRFERNFKGGHRLYKNNNGKFVDVSAKAGIYGSEIGFGLGLTVGDVNNDGWDDIYVSNDFFEKDYLYLNQKDGTFKEVIDEAMGHISQASMGSDMMDINNDGYLDIFTSDMLPETDFKLKTTTTFDDYNVANAKIKTNFHHQYSANCLQLNNGDGTFSEVAAYSGINATDWSWGALSFDFNNDGLKDIFVSNGISKDLTNQDFLNYFSSDVVFNTAKAGNLDFKVMMDKMQSNPIANYGFVNKNNSFFNNETTNLGLDALSFSNGAAYGDLDNDGDLDLIVNNENQIAFVYKNTARQTLQTNYLKIKLLGTGKNTFGYGAKVIIYAKKQMQMLQQMPSRGFQSSVEPILSFGLNSITKIDSLMVLWPNLMSQTIYNVKCNTSLALKQINANKPFKEIIKTQNVLYTNVSTTSLKGNITHKENNYIDFNNERLMPKMLSAEGPRISKADVNADGLEDIFVGGAKGDESKLYLQTPNGFKQFVQTVFSQINFTDNTDAVFFDADNDGDKDLLLVYGGNEDKLGSIFLQPKLFLNNGKGLFDRSAGLLPLLSINAACVRVNDYDNDGDIDIFLGARSIPGAYGVPPKSALLQNNGQALFTNVTQKFAPVLQNLGMVTDAQWADIDNDNTEELIVVGDWMPVTILKTKNNKLEIAYTIPNSLGWWNCVNVTDVDGDGQLDILAGNLGQNSKIKASITQPASLYINDFDNNGQPEPIAVYYKPDGKPYPFNLKNDLVSQIPSLKKKFLRFDAYAGKSIEDVFTPELLSQSIHLQVNETKTSLYKNMGKGKFESQLLPFQIQLSPVYTILVSDFNSDNKSDIFFGGNFYGLKPEVGKYDASYGATLLAKTNSKFDFVKPKQVGLFIKGEVRYAIEVVNKTKNYIIISRNNDDLQLFLKK